MSQLTLCSIFYFFLIQTNLRFGEHQGSFCTLASFKNGSEEMTLEEVNLDEIHKKSLELKEKVNLTLTGFFCFVCFLNS